MSTIGSGRAMSRRIQYTGFAIIFCFTLLVTVNLSNVGTIHSSSGYAPTIQDPTSASVGQVGTFPAQNGQLLPDENYNFTASLRDEANLGRAYDGGYLTVTKGGDVYRNTSFTPLGTFPGTLSFDNDRVGGLADNLTYDSGGTWVVEESKLGHSKVLKQTGVASWKNARYVFPSLTFTLVYDFWALSDAVPTPSSQTTQFYLTDSGAHDGAYIAVAYDNANSMARWGYYNGPTWTFNGGAFVANRWYHHHINASIASDKFDWYVDGIQMTPAGGGQLRDTTSLTNFSRLALGVVTGNLWVDALDFDFNPNYVQNRSMKDLSPIGIYNATSSFENDAPYSVSAGWTDASSGTCRSYCLPGVTTAASGHKNVFCLEDISTTYTASAGCSFPAQSAGRIAFWTYMTNTGAYYLWQTLDASLNYLSTLDIQSGNLIAYTTGAVQITVMAVSPNTWYYIEISFNAGVWDLYVNGLLKQSGLGYYSSSSNPATTFGFHTYGLTTGNLYVDAVDFSWDPEYSPGRASYMQLQQNITFAEEGSYSFRYTLSSSGADYPGVWTLFSVLGPEVPQVPTHGIFFSASSEDLIGVPEGTVFLYVDDALKSWGTVELVNGTHYVTVRDYFGVVLSSNEELFNASGNYGIVLPMATLVANNFNDKPAALEITKSGGTGTLRQLLGPQDSFAVRLASGSYHVRLYDLDGTMIGEYALVSLSASANQEVSFGTAPSLFSMDWMILVGLVSICAVLMIVTIARTGRGGRESRR